MIEEVVDSEKGARKARLKTRLLWIVIALDILIFGYASYEIIMLIIQLIKPQQKKNLSFERSSFIVELVDYFVVVQECFDQSFLSSFQTLSY